MKSNLVRLTLVSVALLACAAALRAAEVTVLSPDSPMLRFALGKLESALQRQSATMKKTTNQAPGQGAEIVVTVDPTALTDLGRDGFRRVSSREGLRISGGDERGAMYGVLDAAEQIRLGTPWNTIADRTVKAQFEFRALKFNLPWAAYRTSPVIEQHDATCSRVIRVRGDFGESSSLSHDFGSGAKLDQGRYRFAFRVRGTPGQSVNFELADGSRKVAKETQIPLTQDWQEHIIAFEITTAFTEQTTLRFRLPREGEGTFDLTDTRLNVAK